MDVPYRFPIIEHCSPKVRYRSATMFQHFPNTTLIHGSVEGGIGRLLTNNISWQFNENPWNRPGLQSDNQTHLTCLTNNATLQAVCCQTVGGDIVDSNGRAVENVTAPNGGSFWCSLPETGTYNDHYNTQPVLVTSWAQCYNSSVTAANNPGVYHRDIKPTSDIWTCELAGNFSGSSSWEYPIYASAANSASSAQVGRFSLLAVAAVISVATLAASALCKLFKRLSQADRI
jgi:hypothetical protein